VSTARARHVRASACVSLGVALFLGPGTAGAQQPPQGQQAQQPTATERAMAEGLFRDAKKLLQRGKTPEACEKLRASYKIDPAGGTLINLAMCHEIEGKTASAWTEFSEALAAAKKAARPDREKAAREHLTALEPRMSHVTVTVATDGAPPGLEVRLDGITVESKALGTAIAVDPGDHVATASAPGRRSWESKVTLKEGESRALAVPALASDAPLPPPPPPPKPSWRTPLGIAATGVGAVLLGVGAGFGARAISVGARANDECPNRVCSATGLSDVSSARSAASISNGTLVAGGVVAAAGVTLLVLSVVTPSADAAPAPAPSVSLLPAVTFGSSAPAGKAPSFSLVAGGVF
jgi:hypothetical protein